MKGMLWKEFRETAGWAILFCIAMLLAHAYTLGRSTNYYENTGELWMSGVPMQVGLYSAACAALMGALQTASETRRDQWAFLLHRPISPALIFAAKSIVGVSLVCAASSAAYILVFWWCTVPGHLAVPVRWPLVVPGLVDILAGIPYYFAAMLAVLRPARWYGSRLIPFVVALIVAGFAANLPAVWQALTVCAGGTLLLGAGARGAFVAGGEYVSLPRYGRVALATTFFFGWAAALGMLFTTASQTLQSLAGSSPEYSNTYYAVDSQGRVVRNIIERGKGVKRTDLAGNPLPTPSPDDTQSGNGDVQMSGLSSETLSVASQLPGYHSTERYFELWGYPRGVGSVWFYLPFEGTVEGYDPFTRRPVGYLGPDGFTAGDTPPRAKFPLQPLELSPFRMTTDLLWFPDSLYWLDTDKQTVTLLYHSDAPGGLLAADEVRRTYEHPIGAAVMTNQDIQLFAPSGKLLLKRAPDFDRVQYPTVQIGKIPGRNAYALWYYPEYRYDQPEETAPPSHVLEVTPGGQLLLSQTLPNPDRNRYRAPFFETAPLAVVPLPIQAFCTIWLGHHLDSQSWYMEFLGQYRNEDARTVVFSIACTLLAAGLVFPVARRCAWRVSLTWRWVLTVLLLGPAALLALLSLVPWPARKPCPNCGRERVVDRDTCEHCGQPWRAPEPDGTEIFQVSRTEALLEVAA